MRDPLPKFLMPTVDMKKAIELNAKEDEILSAALEKLEKERRMAMCNFWDKKGAFIQETSARRKMNWGLRRRISVDKLDVRHQKNSSYAALSKIDFSSSLQPSSKVVASRVSYNQWKACSNQALTTKTNTAAATLETGVAVSKKTAHHKCRKDPLVTQSKSTDKLPSLNVNNYFKARQNGNSALKSEIPRRISIAAVPTPPSVTKRRRRRATIPQL